jgi:PhzF family phenazine biosynthesis protein
VSTILHVVDAFAGRPFSGNPAAVCILPSPRDELWMKLVAREMNLSETAFLHRVEDGWSLRWFTPAAEVDLCGHATLASAHTLWETGTAPPDELLRFHTRSGWLTCRRDDNGIIMDFPAKIAQPCEIPAGMNDALGCEVLAASLNGMDFLLEVASEPVLRKLRPRFDALAALPVRGTIVTARSDDPSFDFVSRFFAPAVGVNEDPVTGSAHCALGPYWAGKLGKTDFTAYQASERGGIVRVSVRGDRVLLAGNAVTVSRVELMPVASAA